MASLNSGALFKDSNDIALIQVQPHNSPLTFDVPRIQYPGGVIMELDPIYNLKYELGILN